MEMNEKRIRINKKKMKLGYLMALFCALLWALWYIPGNMLWTVDPFLTMNEEMIVEHGDLVTDFAVTLQKSDGSSINFENVQVSVDSTGRANQLLRRVETRLDPADIFFPYPQYEIELGDTGDDTLSKYFWITANCWTERGTCANNGSL